MTTCTAAPLSPMYEDIGGWWLSCDPCSAVSATPFASDGSPRTSTATCTRPPSRHVDPLDPGQEYGFAISAVVPEPPTTPLASGPTSAPSARLRDGVSPTGGATVGSRDASTTSTTSKACSPRRTPCPRPLASVRGRDRHSRPPLEDPLDAELRPVKRDAQPPGSDAGDAREGRQRPPGRLQTAPGIATGTRSRRSGR